jgi:hypothetical protein
MFINRSLAGQMAGLRRDQASSVPAAPAAASSVPLGVSYHGFSKFILTVVLFCNEMHAFRPGATKKGHFRAVNEWLVRRLPRAVRGVPKTGQNSPPKTATEGRLPPLGPPSISPAFPQGALFP